MKIIDDISDFIFIRDEIKEADIIFIPGGSHPELGEYGRIAAMRKSVRPGNDEIRKRFIIHCLCYEPESKRTGNNQDKLKK